MNEGEKAWGGGGLEFGFVYRPKFNAHPNGGIRSLNSSFPIPKLNSMHPNTT
jgi:hypothetical protein